MLRSGDLLHPRLLGEIYDDKPPVSYWLMIAAARVIGGLTEAALRLPDALAGALTLACTVRIATRLWDRRTALIAGWVLLSTCLFPWWARIASADMLNVAAVIAALAWYVEIRESPGFFARAGFLVLLAVGALMKGLIAPALAVACVAPDLVRQKRWRAWTRPSTALALPVAALVYLAPFAIAGKAQAEEGLAMVFRENVLRFFAPFDHRDSPFLYLLYLPLYALPWTPCLVAALVRCARDRRLAGSAPRWIAGAWCLSLALLTASGSRRGYYVLPLLPLGALLVAEWLASRAPGDRLVRWSTALAVASIGGQLAWHVGIAPWLAATGGKPALGADVKTVCDELAPGAKWTYASAGATVAAVFYVAPPDAAPIRVPFRDDGGVRDLAARTDALVVVATLVDAPRLERALPGAARVEERSPLPPELDWLAKPPDRTHVAFVVVRAAKPAAR